MTRFLLDFDTIKLIFRRVILIEFRKKALFWLVFNTNVHISDVKLGNPAFMLELRKSDSFEQPYYNVQTAYPFLLSTRLHPLDR